MNPSTSRRLGDLKFRHIEAALDVEEASLSQIHRTVGKQISRLQLEERMLKMLQEQLLEEGGLTHEDAAILVASGTVPPTNIEETDNDTEDTEQDAGPSKKPNKSNKGTGIPSAAGNSIGKGGRSRQGPTKKRKT